MGSTKGSYSMPAQREIVVSDTDELTVADGLKPTRSRNLSDFTPTNAPLSAAEIEFRKQLRRK